jgi:O-antigen ligase
MSWRVIGILTLVAWGALSFGAVYPWAYVPLYGGCAAFASAYLVRRERASQSEVSIAISFAIVVAAVAIQLIPLPVDVLRRISPSTDELLKGYIVGYPESTPTHPISIGPALTATALSAAIALSLFLLGLLRAIDRSDLALIIRGLAIVGAALTLVAIAQKGMSAQRIYGLWLPLEPASPYGPFVNRNHFAGWMLMVMPLTIGYLIARVTQGMRHVGRGWRSRIVWFSSSEASETILIAFAVFLMALGLTMSTSRSGTLGLIGALAISAWFVVRRRTASISRRGVLTTYFIFVMVIAIGWAGVDRLAARFGEGDPVTIGNRTIIWSDTLTIAKDFPFFGTGLNTYGVSTLFYQTVMPETHLAQAHNDYLQLMAEGGALVGVPVLFAVVVLVRLIRKRFRQVPSESTDYWIRIGAVTGITAIALQEIADFSLQMPGNAVVFVVVLAIASRPVNASAAKAEAGFRIE